MESITQRIFSINLKLMWLLRLYSSDKPTTIFKFQAYFLYVTFICIVACLGTMNIFININVDRTYYDFAILTEIACFVVKYLPFIKNGEQIKKCINYFGSSTLLAELNSREEDIIEECVKICRRNTLIFLMIIIGGVAVFSFTPFFLDGYVLPFDIWLPYDVTSEPYIFYLTHIFVATSVVYMGVISAATDTLIGGLACFATSRLKILQDKLQHLDDYANSVIKKSTKSNMDKAEIIYNQIQHCVNQHSEIKLFTEEFEKCFSPSIFYQIIATILVVCFSCVEIIQLQTLNYLMLITGFGVIVQIYFYCYYGSTVFDESDNLTNAIYMGNWYDYNAKSRKAIIILMARTQKPINLVAGKVFELSVVTFGQVLKKSYSLIAVLKDFS